MRILGSAPRNRDFGLEQKISAKCQSSIFTVLTQRESDKDSVTDAIYDPHQSVQGRDFVPV